MGVPLLWATISLMKHLGILHDAGLIIIKREGKFRWNFINVASIQEIYDRWMSRYAAPLAASMLGVKQHVEKSLKGDRKMSTQKEVSTKQIELELVIQAPRERVWQAIVKEIGKQIFIASVLSGSAAEKAGLQIGDENLSVDGEPYSPIQSLQDKIGGEAIFKIRRTPSGSPIEVKAKPAMCDPKQEFLEAQRNSIRIYEQNGRRIGYVHLWSYAGEEYHDEFLRAISSGALKSAEALIFDLRYG